MKARPPLITLDENLRQEEPPAFMVFAHESLDVDYMVFPQEREARDYALEQEEKSNSPENSWPIYALWAGRYQPFGD